MKITRKQLRRLITETMITPSTEVIRQILDDPEVDERLKVILRADDEESIAQALNLLATIYPDKYDDIDIEIPAQTATTEYEEDFEFKQYLNKDSASYQLYVAQRDRLLKSFEPWLQGTFTSSGRLLTIFEAALAHYFASADYMGLPNTQHEDYLRGDFPSFEVPSGRHPLYHMIAKEFMKTINIDGFPNLADGSSVMSDAYGTSYHMLERLVRDGVLDLEAGITDAIESLKVTGDLYRDDPYLYVFKDPEGWLTTNIPEYSRI